MNVIGHGIDVVSIARIEKYLRSRPEWPEGIFSVAERQLAGDRDGDAGFYAGRFAAKEAVAKALGTGFAGDITWRGIEVLRSESGAPYVRLSGEVLAFATRLGISGWFVSVSRCGETAVASAIAVGG